MGDGRFAKGQAPHNKREWIGLRFGRWVVLAKGMRPRYLRCRCDCGTVSEVFSGNLANGKSPSCGCVTRSVFAARWVTHGRSHTVEYETWARMIARCENPNNESFPNYGGRGIKVHPAWRSSFDDFFAHVGPRPGSGYSIDRFPDVNGNYEPGNVRWATPTEQCRNRRSNRFHTIDRESKTIAEWAELAGVSPGTISRRIRAGFAPERMLLPPMKPGPSKLPMH